MAEIRTAARPGQQRQRATRPPSEACAPSAKGPYCTPSATIKNRSASAAPPEVALIVASSTCSVRSASSACERQSANQRAGAPAEILRRCDSPLRPSSSSSWHRLRRSTQARELKIPGRGTGSSALASARCSGRACGRKLLPRQPSLLRNQPGCHQALSSETADASGSAAHHCYPCLSALCPAEAIRR